MELQPSASSQELLIELVSGLVCMTRDYFDLRCPKNQCNDVAAGLIAGGYSSIGNARTTQKGKRKKVGSITLAFTRFLLSHV